ncbi:hypothetical protein L0Y59_01405, partial [Candidatus Uhrbacteria bacterium]|nr:hypothetical protein [Candidatus Uhrbacteria bacterium]
MPIAGNYFDETLGRIIHDLLSDPEVLGTEKLQYVFPVVAHERKSDNNDHPNASRELWNAIRQAKQRWREDCDFEVVVGSAVEGLGVLRYIPRLPGADVPVTIHGRAGVVIGGNRQDLVLVIPTEQILGDPRIIRLVDFVTHEVVQEALGVAGVGAAEINTLIVSGRGALWPGLRTAVERELRRARSVSFTGEMMKAAVARGAIARYDFVRQNAIDSDDGMRGRLAVVYGHGASTTAVFEDQWDRPIRIPVAQFRIVDVVLRSPDPARDLGNGSLR